MLFLINQSPFTSNVLTHCSQYATASCEILLIEDGVYAALDNSQFTESVSCLLQQVKIYALKEDAAARGLTDKIMLGIELVDYNSFVELSVKHKKIISWNRHANG